MPIVSGGGGGGAPFNGGTITQALIANTGATATTGVTITGTGAQNADRFLVSYPHQTFEVTDDGVVTIASDDGLAVQVNGNGGQPASFTVAGSAASRLDTQISTGAGIQITQVGAADNALQVQNAGGTPVFLVYPSRMLFHYNAAPADAALSAGDCAIWFDQTNGAAKFMLKGKTANGTVVAASVALA